MFLLLMQAMANLPMIGSSGFNNWSIMYPHTPNRIFETESSRGQLDEDKVKKAVRLNLKN